jgi:hypothetical protein
MSDVHLHGTYEIASAYNDNKIVLLAKDPNWLFAYWEISDEKKNSFNQDFGQDLWVKSSPVIKVINITKGTCFYVFINDSSSNWYIHVEDPDSMYAAELGRLVSDRFFINLASSNCTVTPNNSVSSNTSAYFINYNDLKNGRLDAQTGKIYETYNLKTEAQEIFGISSLELFGINLHELVSGISSTQLFGAKATENLGKSSENLIR